MQLMGRWAVSLEEIDVIPFSISDGSYYVPTLFTKLLILGTQPFDDSLCRALKTLDFPHVVSSPTFLLLCCRHRYLVHSLLFMKKEKGKHLSRFLQNNIDENNN